MSLEWCNIMPNNETILIEGCKKAISRTELDAILKHLIDSGEVTTNEEYAEAEERIRKAEDECFRLHALKRPIIDSLNRLDRQDSPNDPWYDYLDSATCKGGMSETQFFKFMECINIFNNVIHAETRAIYMKNNFVSLSEIPFDSRLKCLLTPISITYDLYDPEMKDFKVRRDFTQDGISDVSIEDWITLQQKFFRNWRGKKADESNSLRDLLERATLQQVGRRAFFEDGELSRSNYFIPNPGEIYQMPVRLPFTMWGANRDCITYDQAVRRTYLGLFDRLADSTK